MKVLEVIEEYTAFIVIVLLAVFTFPYFGASAVLPKEILLVAGVSLMLLIWVTKSVIKGSMTFSVGKYDLAVLLIATTYLVSAILKTPNKMEAFFLPGTATFILAGSLFYFLLNQFKKETKTGIVYSLIISGLLLSISVLFTETGIFAKIPWLSALVKDPGFNPLGGSLPSVMFLAALLPLIADVFVKHKELVLKLFMGISAFIVILGIIVGIKNILPGKPQAIKLASFSTSWSIAVDTLKVSPIWGIGPANYLTAFSRFKPLSYNQTDLWPIRFTTARDYYLTAITELGFVGVFALAMLIILVYKHIAKNLRADNFDSLSVIVLLALFLFFPATPILMVLLLTLLAVFSDSRHAFEPQAASSRVPTLLAGLPIVVGVVFLAFFGIKALSAEYKFRLALDALAKNDAKATFDNVQSAIRINPKVDRYHASLAQIDLALASGVAAKKDITDTDRTTVTQLVQAAISEGKATVVLNPQRSGNWQILARIYRSIMAFAQGADNFAIQTFSQAAALDPIDPNLRISLGGTYYALGRYDEAIETFKLAALAKPDHANAHYNLAIAYREKKDYTKATEEMNTVLSLVGKGSADYETALKELKNIESLTGPETKEESNIKPPIELPEEATPPVSE